jgi:ABC-2 type transport system permease protein
VVVNATATSARPMRLRPPVPYRTFGAMVSAGFRRYSTYRQAMAAGIVANTVFGFLNCYVMLAVARGNGGSVAGYDSGQIALFVWINQGLLATVGIWGDVELGERIRSGAVVADLLRPVHPVLLYLANDLGRAGFATFTRFAVPMVIGALAFDVYTPRRPGTYPLFALSLLLAVLISFACRYLVNSAAYWLLDSRGPQLVWNLASTLLGGLYFPLHFLPTGAVVALWLATPFPSLFQGPADLVTERADPVNQVVIVAGQVGWAAVVLGLCVVVQRAAERRLVIQGG